MITLEQCEHISGYAYGSGPAHDLWLIRTHRDLVLPEVHQGTGQRPDQASASVQHLGSTFSSSRSTTPDIVLVDFGHDWGSE